MSLGDLVAKSKFCPGDVVWGLVPDRNGVSKPNPRPLLVIDPGPETKEQDLVCLAVSTRKGDDEKDPAVEMAWDAEAGSTTGLFEWCRVVLLRCVLVDQQSVRKSGRVTDAFLARITEERNRARAMLR